MSAATTLPPSQAGFTTEPIYRLSVDQWHDLIARGKLSSDDPVELIEGIPVFKMPKNPPHAITTGLLADRLVPVVPAGWHVRVQEPVTLGDGEPEPDLAITRGRRVDYVARHPGPSDVAFVIEVSDSTLDRDRGIKLRSYARSGVECYWIVSLIDRRIEVYTNPLNSGTESQYGAKTDYVSGEAIPVVLDGHNVGHVDVDDVLPPA